MLRFANLGLVNRFTARREYFEDRWLVLIWAALVLIGPPVLLIFAAGLPLFYSQLSAACPDVCEDFRMPAATAKGWEAAGLSLQVYAWTIVVLAIGLMLICTILSALLLLRRPRDRMAVFTALMLVLLGATYSNADELVGQSTPWMGVVTDFINQLGFGLFPFLLITIPDGRFVPSWTRWPALAILLLALSGLAVLNIQLPDTMFMLLLPVWGLIGPLSQVYRFRRKASPMQKQQLKWVVTGVSLGVSGFILAVIGGFLLGYPDGAGPFAFVAIEVGLYFSISFVPVSIGVGILRYRLWEIDLVVRRTLQYTLLTALLALVYFGGVILLQGLLGPMAGGENSPLVTVLTTLVVAALFNPLRRRTQAFIDRRFFRQKYNAESILDGFAAVARDEVDIEVLAAALLESVNGTMQPRHASIWLGTGTRRERWI